MKASYNARLAGYNIEKPIYFIQALNSETLEIIHKIIKNL